MLEYHKPDFKRCSKCILPETMPYILFDTNGICNYCLNYTHRNNPRPKSELFDLDNVFLSPHISGNFSRYQEFMIKQFNQMLIKFINGKTIKNRVCKKRLY